MFKFKVQAICDSYIGCDVETEVSVVMKEAIDDDDIVHPDDEDDESDSESEDEEDEEGGFLGFASFGEFVLTMGLFAIVAAVVVNALIQHGYWDKHIDPVIQRVLAFLEPKYKVFLKPYVEKALTAVGIWE